MTDRTPLDPERDRLSGRVRRFAQVGAGLGRAGAAYIGNQQVAISALSAAVAAAGSMLIQTGAF